MANGSSQQSATCNLSGVRELLDETIAGIEDVFLFHSIV